MSKSIKLTLDPEVAEKLAQHIESALDTLSPELKAEWARLINEGKKPILKILNDEMYTTVVEEEKE